MKISFNQTYGDNRNELLEYRFKDKKMSELLSYFDMNIFSFHNCSDETINKFIYKQRNTNFFKNVYVLKFYNISYNQCISKLLKFIKMHNVDYFLFYQDDTFSYDNGDIDFKELIEYTTSKDDIMLNLSYKMSLVNGTPSYNGKTFSIADTSSHDFEQAKLWSFDDSAFICSQNYLDDIYDNTYLSFSEIWSSENYLNVKFKTNKIQRKTLNKQLFKNYNIIGPNSWNAKNDRENLISKFH